MKTARWRACRNCWSFAPNTYQDAHGGGPHPLSHAARRYVRRVAEAVLPTQFGDFRMIAYASDVDLTSTSRWFAENWKDPEPALVRVHSHCLTGDVFRLNGVRLLRTGTAIAGGDCKGRSRRVPVFASHRAWVFRGDTESQGHCSDPFSFTRATGSRAGADAHGAHESGIGAQILIDLD